MAVDVKTWAGKFKSLTDSNETIQCMGRYYTCRFMYDMTERKVIIEMHDGKVKEINTDPQPLDPYDFALRASPQTWREFAEPVPQTHVPRHLGGEFPRGSEARGQSAGPDAESQKLHRAVRAAAPVRRPGLGRRTRRRVERSNAQGVESWSAIPR